MLEKAYPFRFQIFLFTLIAILFGILLFPDNLYENILSPIIFLSNLTAGIILISKRKKLTIFLIILLIIASVDFGSEIMQLAKNDMLRFVKLGVYFLFYIVVTYEIIKQVWITKTVNVQVIYGVISGYISLGLVAYFICMSIEMFNPGSFQGISTSNENNEILSDSIMYYSYITMLTIGYGEIVPATQVAQKSSILIGLMGQFYMVIITAIIVGKYISQSVRK